jgi:hypothetical protein
MEAPMQQLAQTIIAVVGRQPGISDCNLAVATHGRRVQQLVNGECRHLANGGKLIRRKRHDGIIGNYLLAPKPSRSP